MTHPCLSSRQLMDALHGTLADEAQRHLDGCGRCGKRVALFRRIASAGVESIAETAGQVDALVARLLVTPRHQWWKTVREKEYRRADVVRRLMALADDAGLRDRKLSVAFVTAATRIVDVLPRDTRHVADLRFETWKFASAIFREAGKYAETERALARAEEEAQTATDPELAQASALFSRALLFAEPDVWRPDDAAELLDRAESVFGRRDPKRLQAVQTARAFLLFRSGNFPTARRAFMEILQSAPTREVYRNALTNLMFARVELNETDEEVVQAVDLLIREYAALDRAVHAASARWLMGKIRRLRGEYDEAEAQLRIAMREIGDTDSAIRVGLDLLETLLLAARYEEAIPLARELSAEAVTLDRREPTRRRSLTAAVFAYAREAAQRGSLTADLVAELSRYVDRIHRQRPTDFIPPMPLADM